MKNIFVSHSGGLDSSTLLIDILERYPQSNVYPITMKYPAINNAVERQAQVLLYEYIKPYYPNLQPAITLNLEQLYLNFGDIQKASENKFYFPNRNMLFLSIIASVGEIVGNEDIGLALGIHKHTTYQNYWDITPDFAKAAQQLLSLNPCKVTLLTPFIDLTKADIAAVAATHNLPFHLTWTCYNPVETLTGTSSIYRPCGVCEACVERANVYPNLKDIINDYTIEFK